MALPKKGLGKGLDALFEDNHVEEKTVTQLKISLVEPNPQQPRSVFNEAALSELADSIRTHGILQPLVVRPLEKGGYQIVAGERRWRAARMAGLTEIPVIVKDLNDLETLEIAIIENLQREDLNPVELALGYQLLMDQHGMTQEEVALKVGKSRPVIANTVRLLNLPDPLLENLKDGTLSAGHARALLALEDDELILDLARKAMDQKLLVRDVERLAKQKLAAEQPKKGEPQKSSRPTAGWGYSYYKELELALSTELGRKVTLAQTDGKGTLTLEFYSKEDLQELAGLLGAAKE